jgi:hypothetical protein
MFTLNPTGEYFGVKIDTTNKRLNATICKKMAELVRVFELIDRYLLDCFKIRAKIVHEFDETSTLNHIIVIESTGINDYREENIRLFLRSGKEIILSNLVNITDFEKYIEFEDHLRIFFVSIHDSIIRDVLPRTIIDLRMDRYKLISLLHNITITIKRSALNDKLLITSL